MSIIHNPSPLLPTSTSQNLLVSFTTPHFTSPMPLPPTSWFCVDKFRPPVPPWLASTSSSACLQLGVVSECMLCLYTGWRNFFFFHFDFYDVPFYIYDVLVGFLSFCNIHIFVKIWTMNGWFLLSECLTALKHENLSVCCHTFMSIQNMLGLPLMNLMDDEEKCWRF